MTAMDEIHLRSDGSEAIVVPERGAICTSLRIDGVDVLYLDDSTLDDATKNVRGGIPVLFPSPGKLVDDAWSRNGHHGSLRQHGFAREEPWVVVDESPDHATLRLDHGAWPWPFSLELTFTLAGRTLRLDQHVTNRSDEKMPFGLGFHPYFYVPQATKASVSVPSSATRAFDNVTKQEIAFAPIDLTAKEVDLHLVDHGRASAELVWNDGRAIRLRGSPEYTSWVIWTLAGKDFVCLEPWTCPGDALNTGAGLIELLPSETRALYIEVSVQGT